MNLPHDTVIDNALHDKIKHITKDTNYFNIDKVESVNLYFFYSVNNILEKYNKLVIPLKNGKLSKDELMTNIVKNRMNDGRRFNINSIYSYQFNTEEIAKFVTEPKLKMEEYAQVQDIQFKPMIELFQHHCSIFVLLNNEKMKHSKKIYDKPKINNKTLKV